MKRDDVINVDFSDFAGRQVLMFAKQTRQGRAIPLYFQFFRHPLEDISQNTFILQTVEAFLAMVGSEIHLVFDRGFASPSIVRKLHEFKVKFTIRIKQNKHVLPRGSRVPCAASKLHHRDRRVTIYDLPLRILRSHPSTGDAQPWYLVTNDTQHSTDELLGIYYHRFEIEEFFKDAKRLSDLEHLRAVSDRTFEMILWFVLLGSWVVWSVRQIQRAWNRASLFSKRKRSLLRFWFEILAKECARIVKRRLSFSYG